MQSKDHVTAHTAGNLPTNDVPLAEALPLAYARLEKLDHIGGCAGLSGTSPTPFLELSLLFIHAGNATMFATFVTNENPVIALMGLVCLWQTDSNAFESAYAKFDDDLRVITVWNGGCMPSRMQVRDIAKKLQQDRNFLDHTSRYSELEAFRRRLRSGFVPRDTVAVVHPR